MEKINNKSISLGGFFSVVNKKHYLVVFIVCLLLGVVVSFSIPKSYTTKVMLAPETSSETSGLSGNLASVASMVGMNMSGIGSDAIFPEIYPDVVTSTAFLVHLSSMKVKTLDGKLSTTLYDYMENYQKLPWWFGIFSSNKKKNTGLNLNQRMLNKEQTMVIKEIANSVSCSVDQNTGVITIKASAQDAGISASIADTLSVSLQNFITNYRTNKARNDLANIQKLYAEAKLRYEKARQKYAFYADANQDLVLESFKAKETELENEMQLQYNIYTQLTAQLQSARAKVIEKTPVYAVIQPSTVPYRPSSPRKFIIIAAFLLIGISGYTAYAIFKIMRDNA